MAELHTYPQQTTITNEDYAIGFRDNGDATYTTYKYSYAGVIDYISKIITVTVGGTVVGDEFFNVQPPKVLFLNGQAYLLGVHFTWDPGNCYLLDGLIVVTGQIVAAIK